MGSEMCIRDRMKISRRSWQAFFAGFFSKGLALRLGNIRLTIFFLSLRNTRNHIVKRLGANKQKVFVDVRN